MASKNKGIATTKYTKFTKVEGVHDENKPAETHFACFVYFVVAWDGLLPPGLAKQHFQVVGREAADDAVVGGNDGIGEIAFGFL